MKDFLAYVAEDIINKYGTDLSHVAIVFPNKRASLFLNDHLARLAGKPIWSPAYITISDLFRQQSPLQVADPIKQVCDLHKSFCLCTGSDETLDKFYGWGQLLLSDFDDIDKNMADADRVFANLRDIHELDDISYLTDEQREMIRRFFSNFSEEHNSELKERFLRLWSHLADIYHDFNRRLAAQGLAYEGALYRQVVENQQDSLRIQGPSHYLFVGFNLLQKVEQQLFSLLQREGIARFYWDFDHYYMQRHEAGQYIAQYLHSFPNELDNQRSDIYGNFNRPKSISYISAPTENIQAHYVSNWLREQSRYKDGRRTAIVLCDEKLLATVIHCLPDEVEKVNITTGYPLSQTPVASFIQLYFNLHLGGHSPRLVRTFQRHPYAKYLEVRGEMREVRDVTNEDGPGPVNFNVNVPSPLVDVLVDVDVNKVGLGQLSTLLRQIAQNADTTDPLFQESMFRAYTLINRVNELILSGDLCVNDTTLQRLVNQLVQQTSIPFHGEPAEGVQVMGILETRNLDFDHVLLLSCNEGNMPRGVNDSSFIPHSIRRAYELTTVENKVGIYAYYFHRLLQRAKDVTILYNCSTEDGQRGEMSRFMLQLMAESVHTVTQSTLMLAAPSDSPKGERTSTSTKGEGLGPKPIAKTAHVMRILTQPTPSPLVDVLVDVDVNKVEPLILSPTAINKYIRCPLQFYYRYVADIKEPDLPDDEQELDNRIFGNIFHEAADIIYKQLPRDVTRDVLDHLLRTKVEIERAVDEAFHREMPYMPASGLHLINREVIIHYLRQLVEIDKRLAPFTILGLECDVFRELSIGTSIALKVGGRIDRLDKTNDGRIRVVDYKTGGRKLKALPDVESIFDPERIHDHSDYYLQTFLYADIVSRQHLAAPHARRELSQREQPHTKVSPALLFIQHAASEDYDPTLCFGKEKITDIADYSTRFNELLEQKIADIFSPDVPFVPTSDLRVCSTCPYAQLCCR